MWPDIVVFILFALFSITYGRYNTEVFTIKPNSARHVINKVERNYNVFNVGRPPITAQLIWGDAFEWQGVVQQGKLAHGQSKILFNKAPYGYQAIKIINNENETAFAHVYAVASGYNDYDNAVTSFFNIDKGELAKVTISTGVSHIPIAGEILSKIVEFFWPKQEEDVWTKIEGKVKTLVDTNIQEAINGILGSLLNQYKKKIQVCEYEIDHPNITETVAAHFMTVAENMIGLERRFVFDTSTNSVNINFYLLPLYAAAINLKLTFYQYGILHWQKIGLIQEHVNRLKYYTYDVVYEPKVGAADYVNSTCEKKIIQDYNNAYPETLFDQLASLREFCALSALEHLVLWKYLATNPNIKIKPQIPVVVFSTQFGRNTAKQSSQMVIPEALNLKPLIINGTLNYPTKLIVYLTPSNTIGGLQIRRLNEISDYTGPIRRGQPNKVVDFEGKKLINMTARGTGQIDGLEFLFEDGRIEKVGKQNGDTRTFGLDKHHIVGFYMTDSIKLHPFQAANIAVSYQVIV